MHQILEFIVRHCAFLWKAARYRIVDSEVTTSNGGDALLVLDSASLRMRFVRDRGQLFLDFQEPGDGKRREWYSVDLIRRLLTGERQESAVLDTSYAEFVRENLGEIEARFSDPERLAETKRELKRLMNLRAKEMFG